MQDYFPFDATFLDLKAWWLIVLALVAVCVDIWLHVSARRNRSQTSNERQAQALSTCMESCRNIAYPTLGLCEEVAELMEKLLDIVAWNPEQDEDKKKFLLSWLRTFVQSGKQIGKFAKAGRHENFVIYYLPQLPDTASVTERAEHSEKIRKLRLEVGDVKWMALGADFYLVHPAGAELDEQHPATAQETDEMNWAKLSARHRDNTIDGKGDTVRTHI